MMAYQEQEPPRTRDSVDYLGVALPGDATGIEANSAPVQGHDEIGRTSRMGGKPLQWQLASQSTIFKHHHKTWCTSTRACFRTKMTNDDEIEAPELNLTLWGVRPVPRQRRKKKRRHSRASTLNELGGGRSVSPSGIPTHPARAASPAAMSVLFNRGP